MSKEYEAVRAEHSKICNLIDQIKNREWENLPLRERQPVNRAVNQ